MDTRNEDKMVRQIEKSLSNNINENLFMTGRVFDDNKPSISGSSVLALTEGKARQEERKPDYPLVSYDYISGSPTTMSRAEYIRQAREACLRQLSDTQIYSRPYDVNYMEQEVEGTEQLNHKKAKAWSLFREGSLATGLPKEEESPREIAEFHSLIIRTVLAIVIFLSVFLIDKFDFQIGKLTTEVIQEYVTGKDSLINLENIIVTWLK